jgi:putative tryptophan/tyrosine transport system substrate-binding protein
VKRRELLAGLVGVSAASAMRAKAAEKIYRLAFVSPTLPTTAMTETGFLRSFFRELRQLGYVEGQNLAISRFSAGGDPGRYDSLIGEVINAEPDVVVAANSPLILRFKALMKSTPIVALMGDPVAWGIVPSLAHPGGNITGVSADAGEEIWGKRLAILVEAFPKAKRVGFLSTEPFWQSPQGAMVRAAAQKSSVSLIAPALKGVFDDSEYRRVFGELQRENAEILLASDASENLAHIDLILELAGQAHLPALYSYREFVTKGGLMAYAFDLQDMFARGARYADQILKGAKPADMPIYQADKFTLIVNLKTAKTLDVTISPALLSRADEVIE